MRYTRWSPRINAIIDQHIRILTDLILKKIGKKNLYSIILIGGFARGEGSVKIGKDGRILPLNDYDLFVVSDKKIDKELLNRISLKFNKIIGIDSQFSFKESSPVMNFYSDIRAITVKELSNVLPFIKYYEMKKSGRVLWGENALELIPEFKLSEIPIEEGVRFLFNRASLLIECFRSQYLRGRMSEREREAVIFYSAKAYLTCAEALLLISGDFRPSYFQRATKIKAVYKTKFPRLYQEIPDLAEKIEKFTNFKLKPEFEKIAPTTEEAVRIWFVAKENIVKVIKFLLRRYFRRNIVYISGIPHPKRFFFFKSYFWLKVPKIVKMTKGLTVDRLRFLDTPLLIGAERYLNFAYFKALLGSRIFYPCVLFAKGDPWGKIFGATIPLLESIKVNKGHRIYKEKFLIAGRFLGGVYPSPFLPNQRDRRLDVMFKYYADAFRLLQFLSL